MNFKKKLRRNTRESGSVILVVLVFSTVLLIILQGLLANVLLEHRLAITKVAHEKAFYVAEAGLNYYRWHLAHFPGDIHDGNGSTSTAPYIHEYKGPAGNVMGSFALRISGNKECNEVTSVDITSTGWAQENPNTKRTIRAKYARPSIAQFMYILNSNAWFIGTVKGPVHSNQLIRMDGVSHSIMTSSLGNKWCTALCSPNQWVSGVFGSGVDPALWKSPVPQVDFTGIAVDLAKMKNKAQDSGVYLGPTPHRGYHVVFNGNQTFDVYEVQNTYRVTCEMNNNNGTYNRETCRNIIHKQKHIGTYSIPSSCSLIFVEDKLWVDGTIDGRVTIASASVSDPVHETNVILSDNILYEDSDGSDGLTVVSEGNVLIPRNAPEYMEIDGIFMAQKGAFLMPWFRSGNRQKEQLTVFGTAVSNGQPVTQWGCGGGTCTSGFNKQVNIYNPSLVADAPPLTPKVSDEYEFITWEEVPNP